MKKLLLFFAVVSVAGMLSSCNKEPDNMLNGHEFVDLGLPSGTKWATCNVGAETPEAYGDYFAWGETKPKEKYTWETYKLCKGSDTTFTKYCFSYRYGICGADGYTDSLTTLEVIDDAAAANWGEGWRMPSIEEFQELYDNCTCEWTTQDSVSGRKFTAANGNSIFLPAAGFKSYSFDTDSKGHYWSLSLHDGFPYAAYGIKFNPADSTDNLKDVICRNYGHSVRPVCAK